MKSLKDKVILAIDDADSIRSFLRISLEAQGAKFHEADHAEKGLDLCRSIAPDLVVLDLGLPDRDGLDILPEIRAMLAGDNQFIIILSVRKDREVKEKAKHLGANHYITKPFMMEELMETVHHYLSEHPSLFKNV